MIPVPEPIILKCSCCDLPFAVIQRGVLVIISRHHGDRHTNAISATDLLRMLQLPTTVPVDEAVVVV